MAHQIPPTNKMLLQTFEWHTPSTPPAPHETQSQSSHYARLVSRIPSFATLGVTSIWLPPGCKANNPQGNGYDCYDLWDLGEFDQKWTRSTKWGSREELDDLLQKAREMGMEVVWDAVLNHKTAGDRTDVAWAVEVDKEGILPPSERATMAFRHVLMICMRGKTEDTRSVLRARSKLGCATISPVEREKG